MIHPVVLFCPSCELQHIDRGEWATRPHRQHLCEGCRNLWTPSAHPTVGVETINEVANLRADLERTRADRNRIGVKIRTEWMAKCEQVEREKKELKQLLHDARSEIIDLRIQVALKPAQLTEDEAKGTVQTAWVDPKQEPKMITHSAIVQLQKQLKQEEE